MAIQYIQPGKPNQNAYIERFNRTFREEVLDLHLFTRLDDVREAAHCWMIYYNEARPTTRSADSPPPSTAPLTPKVLLLKCLLKGGAYDPPPADGGQSWIRPASEYCPSRSGGRVRSCRGGRQ